MSDEMYFLSKKFNYLIYGAAHGGRAVLSGLEKASYNVTAFLDKRAKELGSVQKISVYTAEEYMGDKENAVVIISIKNSFEHENVAMKLNALGFDKIVYMPNVLVKKDVYEQNFQDIYNKILMGYITEKDTVYYYSKMKTDKRFCDNTLIERRGKWTIVYLPIEIFFTTNLEQCNDLEINQYNDPDLSKMLDKPFCYGLYIMINFFNALGGNSQNMRGDLTDFKKYFLENKHSYMTFEKSDYGFYELMRNRNAVYNTMCSHLNVGMNFFVKEVPVEAEWNEKGYFNIKDGHHRVAFFCSKGLSMIPAKIKTSDYEKWFNVTKAQECLDFSAEYNLELPKNGIEHPIFYCYQDIKRNDHEKILTKLGHFFGRLKYEFANKKVLDLSANYAYYARYFARLNSKVTYIESNYIRKTFVEKINDLMHCNNIEVVQNENNWKEKFDVSILIGEVPYQNQTMNEIWEITNELMIIMFSSEPMKKIFLEKKNDIKYSKYSEVCKCMYNSNLVELGILWK